MAAGGSMTLFEAGIIDHLNSGKYHHLDRYAKDADTYQVMREAFFADTYLTSTNALTEEGELYNVDGNGNRVAAMLFGPKQVIVVAGYNKIVADMEANRKNRGAGQCGAPGSFSTLLPDGRMHALPFGRENLL